MSFRPDEDIRYLNSGVGAYVLGGWKLSGTISAVSGLPVLGVRKRRKFEHSGNGAVGELSGVYKVLGGIGTNNPMVGCFGVLAAGRMPDDGLQCIERSTGQYRKKSVPWTWLYSEQCFDRQKLPSLAREGCTGDETGCVPAEQYASVRSSELRQRQHLHIGELWTYH